jgi:hypothetical protein
MLSKKQGITDERHLKILKAVVRVLAMGLMEVSYGSAFLPPSNSNSNTSNHICRGSSSKQRSSFLLSDYTPSINHWLNFLYVSYLPIIRKFNGFSLLLNVFSGRRNELATYGTLNTAST